MPIGCHSTFFDCRQLLPFISNPLFINWFDFFWPLWLPMSISICTMFIIGGLCVKGLYSSPPDIVRESPAASNLIPQLTGRNPAGPIPLLLNERKMLTQKNQQLYIPEGHIVQSDPPPTQNQNNPSCQLYWIGVCIYHVLHAIKTARHSETETHIYLITNSHIFIPQKKSFVHRSTTKQVDLLVSNGMAGTILAHGQEATSSLKSADSIK